MKQINREHKIVLRGLTKSDYPDIKQIMDRVYKRMGGAWTSSEYETLIKSFLKDRYASKITAMSWRRLLPYWSMRRNSKTVGTLMTMWSAEGR